MRTDIWQRNLAVLWIAQMVGMIGYNVTYPFIPLYVQTLGVKGTTEAAQWAGAIAAASAISMAVAQPVWGNLADRWGRKPMVIRPIVSNAIVTMLMGFASSPEQLLVLRFVQGALTGTIVAANALVATSTPKHRLGFALGLMQVAVFAGMSIGPFVGGIVVDTIGFRATFVMAGIMTIAGAPLVLKFVKEDFTRPQVSTPLTGIWSESWTLITMAAFPMILGVVFLMQLGATVVTPVLTLFVAELTVGENAATAAGTMLAAAGAMSAVSALAVGRLSDRWGPSRVMPVCLLGAAITYFPQSAVQQVWQLFILQMLLGVFVGGLIPSTSTLLATMVPARQRAAAFGLTATANALAGLVGPLSGAGIATHWGMRAVFLATGVVFAFSFVWVSFGFRGRSVSFAPKKAER